MGRCSCRSRGLVIVAEHAPVVVLLDVVNALPDAAAVVQAVHAQLQDLPVSSEVLSIDQLAADLRGQVSAARLVAGEREAMAVVWFGQTDTGSPVVHLVQADGTHTRVRDLQVAGTAIHAEEAALIVRASVMALLARGETTAAVEVNGGVPETAAIPDEAPTSPPVRERGKVLFLRGAFVLASFSAGHVVQPGADLGICIRLGRHANVLVGYTLLPPMEADGQQASAHFNRHPARIELRATWPVKKLLLGPAIALELDYQTAEAFDLQPGLTSAGRTGDLVVAICPAFEIGVPLSGRFTLFAQVVSAIPLNPHHYVVTTAASSEPLLEPWGIRPGLHVGVMVSLF